MFRQAGGGSRELQTGAQVPTQDGAQEPGGGSRQLTVPQPALEAHRDGTGGAQIEIAFAVGRELVPAGQFAAESLVQSPALGIGVARRSPQAGQEQRPEAFSQDAASGGEVGSTERRALPGDTDRRELDVRTDTSHP